jgi:hypothetical protein
MMKRLSSGVISNGGVVFLGREEEVIVEAEQGPALAELEGGAREHGCGDHVAGAVHEEDLLPAVGPERCLSPIDGDLPLASVGVRKGPDIDLGLPGLVRFVGQPLAVGDNMGAASS